MLETDESTEEYDVVTLDYNGRPTLAPRPVSILIGWVTYTFTFLLLGQYGMLLTQAGLILLLSLGVAFISEWFLSCLLPNQLRIQKTGLSLGWCNALLQQTYTPIIPWSTIKSAEFEKASIAQDSIDGSILLTVSESPIPSKSEHPFEMLSKKIWKKREELRDHQMRIYISGIKHKNDRAFFAESLWQYLPKDSVEAGIAVLKPGYPHVKKQANAFAASYKYTESGENLTAKNRLADQQVFTNANELNNEFIPNLARLLPRSIMEEKLRDSLGLEPGEVLNPQVASMQNSLEQGQILLDYKPLRILRPALDKIERSGTLTFCCCILPIAGLMCFAEAFNWTSIVLAIMALIASIPIMLAIFSFANPNQIELSKSGISLIWQRGELFLPSPQIPWENISLVSYQKPANSWPLNTTVNIHVIPESMPFFQRMFYYVFFQPAMVKSKHFRISLIESGLLYGSQGKRFYESITLNLPPERIEPQLADKLLPPAENSFTSLWLSSLTKERVRVEPLEPNDVVGSGKYRVVRQIGSGGQGIAYLAISLEAGDDLAEPVVLKEFIIPSHAGQAGQAKALESVHRECELLQKIDHPFVVKMKDNFVEDHRFYLVLEHARGKSLRNMVNESGPLCESYVRELAVQLCGILSYLHSMTPPVIHRDFTPENVMIDDDGIPKLIDFNVARQSESNVTRTIVGKHSYLPPEQFRGKASTQSDIYALGASLFFALTGADPEPISASHPREASSSVSSSLDLIVYQATQLDTEDRYKSADEMREDLLAQIPQPVV